MDFIRDLELISKRILDHYEVDYSAAKSGWEVVQMFVNFDSRMIRQIPRTIIKSQKIQNASFNDATEEALSKVEEKLRKGEDVSPHLSRRLFDGKFTDPLLADWNIHHLHLSTEAHEKDKRFVKNADYLLFLTISGDTAYFIDVRPHGENYVFAQKHLLKTIADEWPWILELYRIKEATIRIEDEVNNPEEINRMRKGVNVIHKINDAIYLPMGGGVTLAGTSANVTRQCNWLYYLAKDAQRYVIENRSGIDELLSQIDGYNSNDARFRFELDQSGFLIYEESTRAAIRLEDLGLV